MEKLACNLYALFILNHALQTYNVNFHNMHAMPLPLLKDLFFPHLLFFMPTKYICRHTS